MSAHAARPPLRRDTERGMVAGVLAGTARRIGIDVVIVRVGFVCLALLTGGLALLAYLIAWAALPSDRQGSTALLSRFPAPAAGGEWRVAVGLGLLTLSGLLAFRELGIWWSDAIAWPLALAAFGAALLWRRTRGDGDRAPRSATQARLAEAYSGVFGVLLVLGAALLFLSANDIFGGIRDAALTAVVVVVAIGLVLAPFLWRFARNLATERAERIRSQERAEVAAHLHDSVLQTLTLMQKRADDPREVATLARRQERELRAWLSHGRTRSSSKTLAGALEGTAAEVEEAHGVPIDAVVVGDAPLDDRTAALVAATREALVNASKFAPEGGPLALYAETEDERAEVFVRDRGGGFDPDAVPADRRGVRESIVGRMQRHGGRAEIRSSPERGTEVELTIPLDRQGGGPA